MSNQPVARKLLTLLSEGGDRTRLSEVYHPRIVQTEYPNRLLPDGAVRHAEQLLAASQQGTKAVREEKYEVRSVIEQGDHLAMEIGWTAILNVPLGATPAGATMRADFAIFLTFEDGRIVRQQNYDCFHSL